MDKDKLFEMAKDPKYIPGIYNYCDRWCERCPFTDRCLNYDSSEKEFDTPESRDINNKEFWDKLGDNLATTLDMLKQMAEEQGIDLDDMDYEAEEKREKQLRKEAESHKLARTSDEYAKMVNGWFKSEEKLIEEKGEELIRGLEQEWPNTNPMAEAESIKDCIEVVRWYQYQIHVKLMRSLMRDELDIELDKEFPSDSDGSAKVALIGMDRSIAAWGRIREHFPEKTDDILNILVHLDRLRRKTEQDFPKARAFLRPGFDE